MKKGFPKHLTIILKEMCQRVGADFDKINFKKENWFREYKWTEEERDDFEKWLIDYLYKNRKAKKELFQYPLITQNKRELKKAVNWFLLDYGWSIFKNK